MLLRSTRQARLHEPPDTRRDRDRRRRACRASAAPRPYDAAATKARSGWSAPNLIAPTTGRRSRRTCSPASTARRALRSAPAEWYERARDRAPARASARRGSRRRRAPGAAVRRREPALREAADRDRQPSTDAAACSRATTTSRFCARSTTRGSSREALSSRPRLAVARRRLHRPGGRRDSPQAWRGGDDDRGGADAAARRARAPSSAPGSRACTATEGVDVRHRRDRDRRRAQTVTCARCGCRLGSRWRPTTSSSASASSRTCSWLAGSGLAASAACPSTATAARSSRTCSPQATRRRPSIRCSARHVPGSHWEAAGRQGARAARAMLGLDPGRRAAARASGPTSTGSGSSTSVTPGWRTRSRSTAIRAARDFTATFTRAGRPVAALLVDRPRSLPAARKTIENGDSR